MYGGETALPCYYSITAPADVLLMDCSLLSTRLYTLQTQNQTLGTFSGQNRPILSPISTEL